MKHVRILLVDDMPSIRKLITKQFNKIGVIHIDEAVDGTDAWNKLQENPFAYHFVISDWTMPKCSGLELLKRVRATKITTELPFILVTAEGEKYSVKDAMTAGCTDYVLKPFNVHDFSARFAKLFEEAA